MKILFYQLKRKVYINEMNQKYNQETLLLPSMASTSQVHKFKYLSVQSTYMNDLTKAILTREIEHKIL